MVSGGPTGAVAATGGGSQKTAEECSLPSSMLTSTEMPSRGAVAPRWITVMLTETPNGGGRIIENKLMNRPAGSGTTPCSVDSTAVIESVAACCIRSASLTRMFSSLVAANIVCPIRSIWDRWSLICCRSRSLAT